MIKGNANIETGGINEAWLSKVKCIAFPGSLFFLPS